MPRSKRNKLISLTQVDKKDDRTAKAALIERVRDALERYSYVYVVRAVNDRNRLIKEMREELSDSKFFFGKNKVMQVALGRSEVEEHVEGASLVAGRLGGKCGLFLTNREPQEVLDYFDNFRRKEFARSGCTAPRTVELKEGPLTQFSHSLEPYLRELGMPTRLEKGVVTLERDFVVCQEGEVINANQARMLKQFGFKEAEFRVVLDSVFHEGALQVLSQGMDESSE